MMNPLFSGYYFKHQKDGDTVSMIAGRSNGGSFLQVITQDEVLQYDNPKGCRIGRNGIFLNLPGICGTVSYGKLAPLSSDIMGPFRFLPMQCRHKVVSMSHRLTGGFVIGGKFHDFTSGKGYIEGDSGRSFPKKYIWLHCNDFTEPCSIMAAVADIPFGITSFTGCICAIRYKDREYRLATYYGVKVLVIGQNRFVLSQGCFKLEMQVKPGRSHPLKAPKMGEMVHTIHESNCTSGRFRFWDGNHLVFDLQSRNVSFEKDNYS